jgi:hypothetical protein
MRPQLLKLLEIMLEPVVAEFIRLALLFTVAMSIALGILAAVMLALNLVAAWRHAPGGRAEPGVHAFRARR